MRDLFATWEEKERSRGREKERERVGGVVIIAIKPGT